MPQDVTGDQSDSGGTRVSVGQLPGPMLRRRAVSQPDAVLNSRCPEAYPACSYAELDLRARAVAARLGVLLPPGSSVLLAYPPGTDLAGALYGCLYAGMLAVPFTPPGSDRALAITYAAERSRAAAVLTGADSWTSLGVDRRRVQVIEADGRRVGGEPLWRLAESWQPVGVHPTAAAYRRYVPDGPLGGRLDAPLGHGALSVLLGELAHSVRLGVPEESVGWIASIQGIEEAVWRILLPVHV